jgi:hypothetical protein
LFIKGGIDSKGVPNRSKCSVAIHVQTAVVAPWRLLTFPE